MSFYFGNDLDLLMRGTTGSTTGDSSFLINGIPIGKITPKVTIAAKTVTPKKTAMLEMKRVIFSGPATIVYWEDGTKTVVKCGEHDIFDYEKGLAMAICKRVYGNKGNFNNIFEDWLTNKAEYLY